LGAADAKVFENKTYHYAVEYPADWHLETLEGRFAVENFPPEKAVRGARLPEGGAAIIILVPEEIVRVGAGLPRTLDEWVAAGTSHERVLRKSERRIETSHGKTTAIETETECCAVPPFQKSVEWYFEIRGRFFEATLVHRQSDPQAPKLEEALRQVVLSLRVLGN